MGNEKNAEQSAAVRNQNLSETGSTPQLGKFKNADQLAKAYNELQSEFTRKSQLLKQLQRETKNFVHANQADSFKNFDGSNETAADQNEIPVSNAEDKKNGVTVTEASPLSEALQASVDEKENADFQADETSVLAEQTTAALINNPKAAEVLCCFDESKSALAPKPGSLSEDTIKTYILNNPEIAFKLMQSCLGSVETVSLPLTIKGNAGAISLTPPLKPKTIKEASILAEHFFKKN